MPRQGPRVPSISLSLFLWTLRELPVFLYDARDTLTDGITGARLSPAAALAPVGGSHGSCKPVDAGLAVYSSSGGALRPKDVYRPYTVDVISKSGR